VAAVIRTQDLPDGTIHEHKTTAALDRFLAVRRPGVDRVQVLGSIVTDVTIYNTPGCTCHPKETA
jgi:hypothetical protein